MRRTWLTAFLLLSQLLLLSCSQEEKPVPVDLSRKAEISTEKESFTITYAYLPQYSHRVSYERHNPLVEYLRRETGLPVKQVFPDTFDEHMKMVGQAKIDISFSNPAAYVKMAHRYGTWPLRGLSNWTARPTSVDRSSAFPPAPRLQRYAAHGRSAGLGARSGRHLRLPAALGSLERRVRLSTAHLLMMERASLLAFFSARRSQHGLP